MRRAPAEKLSERLETALREIEAKHAKSKSAASEKAASDLEALLAVPLPKESFEQYPELALAEEADLWKAGSQLAALRGDWLKPEARGLLQLLAMFESQEGRLTPELKAEVEALKMELATFPSGGKISEAIRQAFQLYEGIRPGLLKQLPVLEWIGTWPEVRGNGKRVPAELTGRVLQRLINSRQLPPTLQEEFFKIIDRVHQAHPVDFFAHYYPQLADFYRQHRREILVAPPALRLPEEELRPLDLNRPPARYRKWVDQEAPELDLISDSMVQEELLRRQAASLDGPRWPEEYYYLLIKIRALEGIFLHDLKSGAFREQIAKEFNRVMLFEDRGSGEGFSPAGNVERMKAIYLKHRPQILKHLLKKVELDALVGVFPEIRDEPIPRPFELAEIIEVQKHFQNTAKVVERLLRLPVANPHRVALEKILWGFQVPRKDAWDEHFLSTLSKLSDDILRFYLDRREAILRTHPTIPPSDTIEVADPVEPGAALWELEILPQEALKKIEFYAHLFGDHIKEEVYSVPGVVDSSGKVTNILINSTMKKIFDTKLFDTGSAKAITGHIGEITVKPEMASQIRPSPYGRVRAILPLHCGLQIKKMFATVLEFANQPPDFGDSAPASGQIPMRGAMLISLGIGADWVILEAENKIRQGYLKIRPSLLARMDLLGIVEKLPEIQGVPEDVRMQNIDESWSQTDIFENLGKYKAGQWFFAIKAILRQETMPPALWENYPLNEKIFMGKIATDSEGKKLILNAARYYLEHREEILRHLQPWPAEKKD